MAGGYDGITDGGKRVRDFVKNLVTELLTIQFKVKRLDLGDGVSDFQDGIFNVGGINNGVAELTESSKDIGFLLGGTKSHDIGPQDNWIILASIGGNSRDEGAMYTGTKDSKGSIHGIKVSSNESSFFISIDFQFSRDNFVKAFASEKIFHFEAPL